MTTCRSYNHEQDYAWVDDFLVRMADVSGVRPSFLGLLDFMYPLRDHTDSPSAAIGRGLSSGTR